MASTHKQQSHIPHNPFNRPSRTSTSNFTLPFPKHTMKSYVQHHLWQHADHSNPFQFVATMLTIDYAGSQTIYAIDTMCLKHQPHEHDTINKWNAARSEVIAHLIEPPSTLNPFAFFISTRPSTPYSHWCLITLLHYTPRDIEVFESLSLASTQLKAIPLLVASAQCLRKELCHLKDPIIAHYHKTRYNVIRDILDKHYHTLP